MGEDSEPRVSVVVRATVRSLFCTPKQNLTLCVMVVWRERERVSDRTTFI